MMRPNPEKEMLISILKPYAIIPPQSDQEQEEKARQTINEALRLLKRCSVTERIKETDTVKMHGRYFYLPPVAYLWEILREKRYVNACHELYDLIKFQADGQFFTHAILTSTMIALKDAISEG